MIDFENDKISYESICTSGKIGKEGYKKTGTFSESCELDAQGAEELNRRLAALITHLPDRPEATV